MGRWDGAGWAGRPGQARAGAGRRGQGTSGIRHSMHVAPGYNTFHHSVLVGGVLRRWMARVAFTGVGSAGERVSNGATADGGTCQLQPCCCTAYMPGAATCLPACLSEHVCMPACLHALPCPPALPGLQSCAWCSRPPRTSMTPSCSRSLRGGAPCGTTLSSSSFNLKKERPASSGAADGC